MHLAHWSSVRHGARDARSPSTSPLVHGGPRGDAATPPTASAQTPIAKPMRITWYVLADSCGETKKKNELIIATKVQLLSYLQRSMPNKMGKSTSITPTIKKRVHQVHTYLTHSLYNNYYDYKNYFKPSDLIRYSAICTAFSAAPFFIWSPTIQKVRPFSSVRSLRMRPT